MKSKKLEILVLFLVIVLAYTGWKLVWANARCDLLQSEVDHISYDFTEELREKYMWSACGIRPGEESRHLQQWEAECMQRAERKAHDDFACYRQWGYRDARCEFKTLR